MFESGISAYIHAQATVDIYFPVDQKGNAAVCCEQCEVYREGSRRCGITGSLSAYPSRYVGGDCPLNMVEEVKNEKFQTTES